MSKYTRRAIFWVGIYLGMVLAPLLALLLGPMPAGYGFWYDLSMAFGFTGAAMLGTMFFLTARFNRVSAPFGIDIIYYFHRWIAMVALLLILAHPLVLVAEDPGLLGVLGPRWISDYMLAGVISVAALVSLMFTSLWRKGLAIHYDTWRVAHAVLAVAAMVLAYMHIEGVGNFVLTPWKKVLWAMITASWLAVLGYVRLVKPLLMLRRPFRVVDVKQERGQAWSLTLEPQGHSGFSFQPGQFAWLTLWSSPFAMREHPFSIASSARRRLRLNFTIKELGDFTRRIGTVVPGQIAYLDGPYGSFSVDRHPNADYVFIAGGIGIVPMMGMLRTLADRGDRRPLRLIYAYKDWESLTFREELEELKGRLDLEVVYVLAEPEAGWRGERGFVTEELLTRRLPEHPGRYHYYLCGPLAMTSKVEAALRRLGVPMHRIHLELFELA